MNSRNYNGQSWRRMHRELTTGGRGVVTVAKEHYPHPRDAGAIATTTWPVGQIADYALDLGTGLAPLLIREFSDRYEVFLAGVQLTAKLLRYVEAYPEAAACVGGVVFGAAIGTAITGKREGAIIGAGMGLLVVAAVQAIARQQASQG